MQILMPEYYVIAADDLVDLAKKMNDNGGEVIHIRQKEDGEVSISYFRYFEALVYGVKK